MANPITRIILTAVDRTKAAFASVKGGLASLGSTAAGLTGTLSGIFVGLSVVGFIGKIKQAVNAMDEVSKSAQKAGTSTENLSALNFAADQSGVKDITKSLVALVDSLDQAKSGTGPAAEAFKTLRIDPAQFTDSSDALDAIAERFARMPDGVNKTALAIDLFGKKIGPELIPLLNQGREGIQALKDEAAALGVVVGGDAARAAEQFNDNMDKLKTATNGLGVSMANEILPGLNQITDAMVEAAKEGSILKTLWVGMGGLGAAIFTDDLLTNTQKLAKAQNQLNEALADGFEEEHRWVRELRQSILVLKNNVAEEKALGEQRKKDGKNISADLAKNHKEEAKAFKDSINEQISDAKRLQGALQSAFAASLSEQERYNKEAKKLRSDAANSTDGKDQSELKLDGTLATMKLERIKEKGSPEDIRDQAEAVKELAAAIEDQAQKKFMLERANLAEIAAAEKSAAAAGQQAAAIAAQMTANEGRMAEAKQAAEAIDKPVVVDVKPGEQMMQVKQDLTDIKHLIDYIKNTPVSIGGAANGTGGMSEALRTEALKRGNRR